MPSSGQIGYRRTLNGKVKTLPYGCGCKLFEDCFECPYPECMIDRAKGILKQRLVKEFGKDNYC